MIAFIIRGDAVPARMRTKTFNGKSWGYESPNSANYRRAIQAAAQQYAPTHLLTGPLSFTMREFRRRPKSLPKKERYPTKRPDLTNLTKGIEDTLTGIFWHDDAQIVEKHEWKRFGDPPRVEIEIEELTG